MRSLLCAAVLTATLITPALGQQVREAPPQPQEGGQSEHTLTRNDLATWLDGIMPYAIASGDIAGAVIAVVADGEVLALEGYGYADIETQRPVDARTTLFRPGSISKLVTWTAVMQLVERGVLDLDADVNSYLDFSIPPFDGQPITLRHILTHTAGFEEQLKHILAYEAGEQPPFEDIVRTLMPERIYAPGTTPAYSNYATALAGYIVQRSSGTAFDAYVEANIFEPLGMNDATFSQTLSPEQGSRLSSGYGTASGSANSFERIGTTPAGAMSATAPDMAKFMLAHLNEGRLDGAQILKRETAQMMHERQFASFSSLNGMALGFYESAINGHRVISHGGDTASFHSDLHLFIDEGVGLYVSLNSTGTNGAAHTLRALLFSQFADRYFPVETTTTPEIASEIGPDHADRLSGQWVSSRRSATTFLSLMDLLSPTTLSTTTDGQLVGSNLPILGAPVHEWVEVEPYVWQASNSHERLAAAVNDGEPTRFSLDSVAPIMVFEPVPWQRSASWLTPALLASVAIFAASLIHWPTAALVRRRYSAPSPLGGRPLWAYRAVRITALLMLGVLASWFILLIAMLSNFSLLGTGTDIILVSLQCATIAVSVALAVAIFANAVYAFGKQRSIASRAWAIVLILATGIVVWVALVFNLFRIGVGY